MKIFDKAPPSDRLYPYGMNGSEYYKTRKEKSNAASRAYYLKNKDKHKERANSRRAKIRKETPWAYCLISAEQRAKKLKVPFDLTREWAIERFNGCCELSGLQFDHDDPQFWCSIDKINPTLGYVQTNCRFILHALNMMKLSSSSDEGLEKICIAVATMKKRNNRLHSLIDAI